MGSARDIKWVVRTYAGKQAMATAHLIMALGVRTGTRKRYRLTHLPRDM